MGPLLEAYVHLIDNSHRLKSKFIDDFLINGQTLHPEDFDFEVRSFCVLFHASLEGYVEGVAHHVYRDAVEKSHNHELSKAMLALLMNTKELKLEINEDTEFELFFARLNRLLRDQGNKYISQLLKDNHGVGKKYLKNILMRLGVDIHDGWAEFDALDKLVSARGEFAHWNVNYVQGKRRPKPVTPESAEEYYIDCLKLAEKILLSSLKVTGDKKELLTVFLLLMRTRVK